MSDLFAEQDDAIVQHRIASERQDARNALAAGDLDRAPEALAPQVEPEIVVDESPVAPDTLTV